MSRTRTSPVWKLVLLPGHLHDRCLARRIDLRPLHDQALPRHVGRDIDDSALDPRADHVPRNCLGCEVEAAHIHTEGPIEGFLGVFREGASVVHACIVHLKQGQKEG